MYQDHNTYELLVMGITLHGFLLAGLMAIGQLIANHRSTKNILFFGLFLDFTFFELHTLLYQAQILDHYILLNSLLVLFTCEVCFTGFIYPQGRASISLHPARPCLYFNNLSFDIFSGKNHENHARFLL